MSAVVKTDEAMAWESPEPHVRTFAILHERDITPTIKIAAGFISLPVGQEQQKLSFHEGGDVNMEEIYIIVRGRGKFILGDYTYDVEKGKAVYVAPETGHRAVNTGDEPLEMYCVSSPSVFGEVGGYVNFVKGWKRIR